MMNTQSWDLEIVGTWRLLHRRKPVKVTLRQQRLVTALALRGPQPRALAAGLLWPNSTEKQATGSLRETIWTINHQLPGLLSDSLVPGGGMQPVALSPDVVVDAEDIRRRAHAADVSRGSRERGELLALLSEAELLPGWYEDWVLAEQDRWERMRLTVLERLSAECLAAGEIERAKEAALRAVDIDPWRENAHRLLLETYRAEGDQAKMIRVYEDFSERLKAEFGVSPSSRIANVVGGLL